MPGKQPMLLLEMPHLVLANPLVSWHFVLLSQQPWPHRLPGPGAETQ